MSLIKKDSRPAEILSDLFEVSKCIMNVPFDVHKKRINFGKIGRVYRNKGKFEGFRIMRDLESLKKRKLINFYKFKDRDLKIELTNKGKKEVSFLSLDKISLENKKPKDGFYRLVIFDIPVGKDRERRIFREKLKSLDFFKIQYSVFITPYNCEKEIKEISRILDFKFGEEVKILKVFGFNKKNNK